MIGSARPGRAALALLASLGGALLDGVPARAADDCQGTISAAERSNRLPAGLLKAIGAVESGFDPYAVNADGVAYHPGSADAAAALVRKLSRAGALFIDVGCLQVDLHYHPDAFPSIESAFTPAANVAYGAKLLTGNLVQYGDWSSAVAYYHSGDPARQADYLARVAGQLSTYGDGTLQLRGGRPMSRTDGASAPRMATLRLSMMTVTRSVEPAPVFTGGAGR